MSSDDHVCNGIKDETDISSVRSTSEVSVNLLLLTGMIQSKESFTDIVFSIVECVWTCSLGQNKSVCEYSQFVSMGTEQVSLNRTSHFVSMGTEQVSL